MIELSLIVPPSTNALYRNLPGKGRVKTSRYLTWQRAASNELIAQKPKPIAGDVDVSIQVPRDDRRDIDNYCKAILDLLVMHGLIADDRHVIALHVAKLRFNDKRTCRVRISSVETRVAA